MTDCDHDFSVPMYSQDASSEWTGTIAGYACSKCMQPAFEDEWSSVDRWFSNTNVTTFFSVTLTGGTITVRS